MALPYPTGSKRIRFMPKTYTFCPPNVYIRTREGIRSDERPYKLSPCVVGEGKGKTWSFGGRRYSPTCST